MPNVKRQPRRPVESIKVDGRRYMFDNLPFAHDPPRLMLQPGALIDALWRKTWAGDVITVRRRRYWITGADIPIGGVATFFLAPEHKNSAPRYHQYQAMIAWPTGGPEMPTPAPAETPVSEPTSSQKKRTPTPTPAQTKAALDRIATAKDKLGAAIKEAQASGRINAEMADQLNLAAADPEKVEGILGGAEETTSEPINDAHDKITAANDELKTAIKEGLESGHVDQATLDRLNTPPEPTKDEAEAKAKAKADAEARANDRFEVKWKEKEDQSV